MCTVTVVSPEIWVSYEFGLRSERLLSNSLSHIYWSFVWSGSSIHIVVVVTDGAAGMMKLGQLILCEHVVCLAHTHHRVVADVHYEKLLPLVTAIEDPYSEEDEENQADDVAPDLTLPQQLS